MGIFGVWTGRLIAEGKMWVLDELMICLVEHDAT